MVTRRPVIVRIDPKTTSNHPRMPTEPVGEANPRPCGPSIGGFTCQAECGRTFPVKSPDRAPAFSRYVRLAQVKAEPTEAFATGRDQNCRAVCNGLPTRP